MPQVIVTTAGQRESHWHESRFSAASRYVAIGRSAITAALSIPLGVCEPYRAHGGGFPG